MRNLHMSVAVEVFVARGLGGVEQLVVRFITIKHSLKNWPYARSGLINDL